MPNRNFGTFVDDARQNISSRIMALVSPINASSTSTETSQTSSAYEELLRGCVPCPTCRGSGKVEPELEAQLVSFLPVNDERLNPRTKLKVGVALALCFLVAGLTIALLMPRSVAVHTRQWSVTPVRFFEEKKNSFINMLIHYHFNVTNTNFYPIKLAHSAVDGLFDKQKICHGANKTQVWVSMRSTYQHYVVMNVTFTSDPSTKAGTMYCEYTNHIPMEFDLSVSAEYLGHQQQIGIVTMQRVNCFQGPDRYLT